MNFRFVINQSGILLLILSALLAIIGVGQLLIPHIDDVATSAGHAFLLAGCAGFAVGGLAWMMTHNCSRVLERRAAMLLVTVSWHVACLLTAMPFMFWAMLTDDPIADGFRTPINCYFEAVSGLTTTGATILSGIQDLPPSIQLWRVLSHWLGGLGIIVLFVAVLPSIGVGAKRMFRAEAGSQSEGVQPHIRETARVLGYIYLALTGVLALALGLTGVGWFDAVCVAFSTISTGGFANHDASMGAVNSLAQWLIIAFMILAGVNFALYQQLLRRRFRAVWTDIELRTYLITISLAIVLLTLLTLPQVIVLTTGEEVSGSESAFRHAAFNAVSMHTGTGFATANFDLWGQRAAWVLLMLMFCGGCVGSTTGGLKAYRIWVITRILIAQVEKSFRPNVIRPLKIGNTTLDNETKMEVMTYVIGFSSLAIIGTALLLACEPELDADLPTAFTATLASLANIGPGLHRVGPTMTYDWMTPSAKFVMSQLMLLGRLEILSVVVIFSPRFWREV